MKELMNENVLDLNNTDIYRYLNPFDNVELSNLNNSDRLNIIFQIKKYYLELRDKLGISDEITLGLEMEFENAQRDIIESELAKLFSNTDWVVVNDGSLYNGGEINSPKLVDNEQNWIDLATVCDIVDKNAFVLGNTSAHVHIGMQILGNNPKYWANFVKLWMAYENVIFRFLYGEYVTPRNGILEQARPISLDLINKLDRINDRATKVTAYDMFKLLDAGENFKERRKRAINFTNVSKLAPYQYDSEGYMRTIEFRSPNGTFDPIIWQNNVNLLVHLFMYAKSDNFDEDKIIRRMKQILNDGIPSNIYKYSYIYIEQAIELADLIFDNNLDKVYFLRQYLKDGRVSRMALDKSAPFTRRKQVNIV